MAIRDYHAALEKITSAPLTLTEADFSALQDFNPADEIRGRAAMRQAQLAIVAERGPIQTKAIASTRTVSTFNKTLANSILQIAQAVAAIHTRLAELESREANQTAAVAELRKGLIDARGALLALENPQPVRIDMHANDPRH